MTGWAGAPGAADGFGGCGVGPAGSAASVDDADEGFSAFGPWEMVDAADAHGCSAHRIAPGDSGWAVWTIPVPRPGTYQVLVNAPASAGGDGEAAYAVIADGGSEAIQRVDLARSPGLVSLGEHEAVSEVVVHVSGVGERGGLVADAAFLVAGVAPSSGGDGLADSQAGWSPGRGAPPFEALLPLPGGGSGVPLVHSNNPEAFAGDGVLYSTSGMAGMGEAHALDGAFGLYLHHINSSTRRKAVSVVVTSASSSRVSVQVDGSAWTQDQTGGLPIGGSPDYRVSEDWVNERGRVSASTALEPGASSVAWSAALGTNREVDGRLAIWASGPVYVAVVASPEGASALDYLDVVEPTPIHRAGTPPPPIGRTAGVFPFDTWSSPIRLVVPPGEARIGFAVNTATGTRQVPPDVQAFPATVSRPGCAVELAGMYGVVYDLSVQLAHDGADDRPRTVRLGMRSYGAGAPSRFWDGLALVDGAPVHLLCTPSARDAELGRVTLAPGEERVVRVRAMVPGLTAVPQGLFVESR